MRYQPTNAQRCTVAGWMRQTATESIAKLEAILSTNQPLESKCLAMAHRDLYQKVLRLSEQEQQRWCRR